MGKVAEGRAYIGNCRRCDEPVLLACVDGIKLSVSRFSVPYADALIIGRYPLGIFNAWIGIKQIFITTWFPSEGRPARGRLYVCHSCTLRR